MQKEKPKRGDHPNHLEFVSPLTIDEAMKRLEGSKSPAVFLYRIVKVEFSRVDQNTFDFHVIQRNGAEGYGRLTSLSGRSTQVTCDARVTETRITSIKVQIGFTVLLWVLFALMNDGGGKILGLVGLPVLGYMIYYQYMHLPQNMLQDIERGLNYH